MKDVRNHIRCMGIIAGALSHQIFRLEAAAKCVQVLTSIASCSQAWLQPKLVCLKSAPCAEAPQPAMQMSCASGRKVSGCQHAP